MRSDEQISRSLKLQQKEIVMGVTDISKVKVAAELRHGDGKVEKLADDISKISPAGQEVIAEVLGASIEEDEQVNLQPKSKAEFEQAIRTAQANVLRRKQSLKNAKDMLKDEVEVLDEYESFEEAKTELKAAKDELEAAKIESAAVEHATVEVEDAVAELGSANSVLSDLLVVYAGKFNTRTVEADERRLIELTAKLGKVEVEQLSLF